MIDQYLLGSISSLGVYFKPRGLFQAWDLFQAWGLFQVWGLFQAWAAVNRNSLNAWVAVESR